MRSVIFIAVLTALMTGCSSLTKKMVGQFDARNGDFIVIKRDGALYWSPLSKTGDKLSFVGLASPDTDEDLQVPLVVSSESPFLYSTITFSHDYSHVSVEWGGLNQKAGGNRATEYYRQNAK